MIEKGRYGASPLAHLAVAKCADHLPLFLDDARVPLDNNASERSLRRVALGRKNYLFVGDVDAGKSIAGLYTLVSTCEVRGINPVPISPTSSRAYRITPSAGSTSCFPVRARARAEA